MNKSRRIEQSQKSMRGLRLVGEGESGSASTPFGPVKAGLTTTQRTKQAQLEVSLKSLERQVEILEYKYLEVCGTLINVTERLARLTASTLDTDTTKEIK